MTLYNLTSEFLELLEMAADEELDQQTIKDTLEAVEGEFEAKADGYAAVIRNLTGDMEAIKAEEERLHSRRKIIENNIERIKKALESAMNATGKRKFSTELFSFRIQNNAPSLDFVNEAAVPAEFFIPQEPILDRRKLLAYAKANPEESASFATVKQTESLRIQ